MERVEIAIEMYNLWNEMVDKELLHIIKVDFQTYIGNHLLFLFYQNNIR